MSSRQLSIPGRPKPYVMAHRGNSAACPENTLAAFRRALADGADIIETDLHLTADGVFVCIHDGDVDRTTDGHGPVAAMTLAQVKTLSASYGRPEFAAERVPALAELCAILPADVVLALELKTDRFLEPDVCRKLADELAAAGVLDRTVVLSFSLARVEAVAAAAPDHAQGLHHDVEAHAEGGGRPTDRRVLADLLPQPVLRPPGARGGTDHVPTGSRRRKAGCGTTAGWGATRCWRTIPPRRSANWGAGWHDANRIALWHEAHRQGRFAIGRQRLKLQNSLKSKPSYTTLELIFKKNIKRGFATGPAKHKGGDSRQAKRQLTPNTKVGILASAKRQLEPPP